MKFSVGDVVFFNGDDIYSKFIKMYNFKEYGESGFSHIGIITKIEKDDVLIHEAVSKGFTKSYYSKDGLKNLIKDSKIKIITPSIKLKNVYKNSEKYLGRPYAWFDILGIILSFLFNFKFLKITGTNKLICSEAVARILYDSSDKKINISSECNKSYDLVAPMDIYLSKWL